MRVVFEGSQMCIRTRCRNVEQLVGTFKHCVEGTSLFISTLGVRAVGTETPFVVALADGNIALRGRGVIRQVWNNSDNPYQRPGMLLGIRALTPTSIDVFEKMRTRAALEPACLVDRPFAPTPARKAVTDGQPRPRTRQGVPRTITIPPVTSSSARVTVPATGVTTLPITARPAVVISRSQTPSSQGSSQAPSRTAPDALWLAHAQTERLADALVPAFSRATTERLPETFVAPALPAPASPAPLPALPALPALPTPPTPPTPDAGAGAPDRIFEAMHLAHKRRTAELSGASVASGAPAGLVDAAATPATPVLPPVPPPRESLRTRSEKPTVPEPPLLCARGSRRDVVVPGALPLVVSPTTASPDGPVRPDAAPDDADDRDISEPADEFSSEADTFSREVATAPWCPSTAELQIATPPAKTRERSDAAETPPDVSACSRRRSISARRAITRDTTPPPMRTTSSATCRSPEATVHDRCGRMRSRTSTSPLVDRAVSRPSTNPLTSLSESELAGYVECTFFETSQPHVASEITAPSRPRRLLLWGLVGAASLLVASASAYHVQRATAATATTTSSSIVERAYAASVAAAPWMSALPSAPLPQPWAATTTVGATATALAMAMTTVTAMTTTMAAAAAAAMQRATEVATAPCPPPAPARARKHLP